MSATDTRRNFVNPLIKRLDRDTRKRVETQSGQLLLLNDITAFKKVIETTLGIEVPTKELEIARQAGIKKARELHDAFTKNAGKNRLKALERKFPDIDFKGQGLNIGENAFLVASFKSSISIVRDAILRSLEKNLKIDASSKKELQGLVQKGHGEEGLAVSQIQIGTALGLAENKDIRNLLVSNLESYIQEANIVDSNKKKHISVLRDISVNYNKLITKSGNLKADYFSIITFQSQEDNQADKVLEQELVRLLRKFIKSEGFDKVLVEMKGSPSIVDQIESHLLDQLTPKSKKVKVKRKKRVSQKVSGSVTEKNKNYKESKRKVVKKAKKSVKRGKIKTKTTRNEALSVKEIIPFINAQLAETVEANMGSPALNYRTGRFAESARVVRATETAKGYPSLEYTYQLYPYQFFESSSGSKWASIDRDPRTLIDRSIREIAQEFAVGRFYTRRI